MKQDKRDNPKEQSKNLVARPPIVVVLGHVDHGKTTLLDYIRKNCAKAASQSEPRPVAGRESGGITQHIGAYQVEHPSTDSISSPQASSGQIITFIDTPGHEAFSQMRSRGAKVADIAILVVAAEEGVKPQTEEVISHIKKFEIPVVVAINKIDKSAANPGKVIGELAKQGIVVETQGGKVPSVDISAKTGQGVDELLEMILLVAELEELKAGFDKSASGVVIESYLDSQRGPTATLLVREGILKKGDIVLCGDSYGKVKILENFQGNPIGKASPSTPVVVLGLNQAPTVGEKFSVEKSEGVAREKAQREISTPRRSLEVGIPTSPPEGEDVGKEQKALNIILKTDVKGSLEAIEGTFKNIKQEELNINVLKSEVGDISESDIKLACSTGSTIIGFRVKSSTFIFNLAKRQGVKIKTFEVIYELVEEIKKGLTKLLEPEIVRKELGKLKVIAIFRKEKSRMIVGGKVTSGKVENKALADVFRPASLSRSGPAGGNKEKIAKGRITQLQHNKKDMPEVEKGKEAGISFEGEPVIEEGDVLEVYREERKKREL